MLLKVSTLPDNMPPTTSQNDLPMPTQTPETAIGRGLRLVVKLALALALGLIVVAFAVREYALPRVQQHSEAIADAVERKLGVPVRLERVSAQWRGLRPRIMIEGLSVMDEAGDRQFSVAQLEATLAWTSLLKLRPYFHQLVIHEPDMVIRRNSQGALQVAGFVLPTATEVTPETSQNPAALTWLMSQREVLMTGATAHWQDDSRDGSSLALRDLNFRLSTGLDGQRFGLRMTTEDGLFSSLELRGELFQSGLNDWRGRLYVALDGFNADGLARHIDLPVALSAYGDLRGWVDFDPSGLLTATLDLALSDLTLAWSPDQAPLTLESPSGRLVFDGRNGQELGVRSLVFGLPDGSLMRPLDMDLRAETTLAEVQVGGSLSVNRIDLDQLARLLAAAPLDDKMGEMLGGVEPKGVIERLKVSWLSDSTPFSQWNLKGELRDVALAPIGKVPGLKGLSGKVEGDQQGGRFELSMREGAVLMPAVFPSPELKLDTAQVDGGWRRGDKGLELFLETLDFENPDVAGVGSGVYRVDVGRRGEIDLDVRLTRASALAVPTYLPAVLNPQARVWLARALEGGHVPDARLRLRGKLDDFPFESGQDGQFLVTAQVLDAQLNYAPGWPVITGIHGELRFEGPGMQISASRAQLSGVTLTDVLARIETLMDPDDRLLEITGTASGATHDFLKFIANSPVRGYIGGMTDGFVATGEGSLALAIDIPLEDVSRAGTRGEYRFSDNRLILFDGLPELSDAAGLVRFTERSFAVPEAAARFLGEKVTVSAPESVAGKPRFAVRGTTSMASLYRWLDLPALANLAGPAQWRADIALLNNGLDLRVQTDLEGVASSLPQPFNKRTAERWPTEFTLRFLESGARRDMSLSLSQHASASLSLRGTGDSTRIERGGLALNAPLDLKEQGIKLTARLDELDIDAWRQALLPDEEAGVPMPGWLSRVAMALDVSAGRVVVAEESLAAVEFGALFDSAGGWRGQISSDRAAGRFAWQTRGHGKLEAHLSFLSLGADKDGVATQDESTKQSPQVNRLPAMEIKVDRLEWKGRKLGRLSLRAEVDEQYWRLREFELADDNGKLMASGRWLMGGYPVTELDFAMQSDNLGKWLASLGQDEIISGGKASAEGRLSWFGAPYRPDIDSLSGSFDLNAEGGGFRQLEPGVGRLLGVLSLQALPRRLSLDFRDVFSDGFAFDQVSGSISVDAALLITDDLHIAGPAAKVWIKGSADVLRETQDIDVVVQPTLSESVAIGAAAGLLNPAAGVLALLAQRVLADPVERMFAYHYHLSGSWADPRIEKLPSPRNNNQQESR